MFFGHCIGLRKKSGSRGGLFGNSTTIKRQSSRQTADCLGTVSHFVEERRPLRKMPEPTKKAGKWARSHSATFGV